MPTLGLCMIVKNEAEVIARCLDSVRPLIDYALIEDTGSTDGTQQAVADWLAGAGIPGVVIEEPWRDFAYNRSHALAQLREVKEIDYVLMVDAGDVVAPEPGFDVAAFKAALRCDVMELPVRQGELRWLRPQIGSNRAAIALRGVLFECLDDRRPLSVAGAQGLYLQSGHEGVRNRNPAKHREDAALLEQALQGEADPYLAARYRFYLAQSYRDAGEREKARAAYLARAALGGWSEEVFCSLYEAARLDEALGAPADQMLARYARAAEAAPARAEVNYDAARICFREGRFEEAYQCAKGGLGKPAPVDGLFVRTEVYDYRLLDVFAAAARATGRWAEGEAACERMLAEGRAPSDQRERIASSQAQAAERLREAAAAVPGGSDAFLDLLRTARAKVEVEGSAELVLAAYAAASAAAPHRAEALHGAAAFCRKHRRFEVGREFAVKGLTLAQPKEAPGLEGWIYDYGLLVELMVNSFWAGRYVESAEACDRLLREGLFPPQMREGILGNRAALARKL